MAAMCASVVAAVDALAREQRSVRKHRRALARDLLVLLSGFRGGVMLDYCVVSPAALSTMVQALCREGAPHGDKLAVAELDGCCYLLNPRVLTLQTLPAVIDFQEQGSGAVSPCWAEDTVTRELHAQLRTATAVLAKALESDDSGHYVSLCEIPCWPLLPTLNGWLLSYPAIYLVNAENVGRAADALSGETLRLYELHMTSPALEAEFRRVGWRETAGTADIDVICGFTIPGNLQPRDQDRALLDRWLNGWHMAQQTAPESKDKQKQAGDYIGSSHPGGLMPCSLWGRSTLESRIVTMVVRL